MASVLMATAGWLLSSSASPGLEPNPIEVPSPLRVHAVPPMVMDAVHLDAVESIQDGRVGHGDCACEACCGADWSKIPAICPMPRPGNFAVPPTGPGYYSLSDRLTGTCRDKPPKSGYPPFALMPPSFFDADFRYVDAIDPCDRTIVERLKRIQLNDCWMFSTGGQFWLRHMNEVNSRLRVPGPVDNDYTLGRVRLFGDLMYSDRVRLFGEFLWAESFAPDLAPLPIDVDRGDILNLFVDLKVCDGDGHPVYVRGGRQELLLGSQRLISTLDWANTRRTFQGVRAFRRGEKWDADVFWVQPVIPEASDFDEGDSAQNFAGAWLTYRAQKGRFLDFYYLYYGNSDTVTAPLDVPRAPFDLHTLGSRWTGDQCGFLWDVELAMQLGQRAQDDVVAGMATAGLGRHFKNVWATPTAWIYYDYASGDSDPDDGTSHTFNQQFPFGHYYLGWIDLVGRQNIHDLNAHVYFYPAPWITMFVQYHQFWLNQPTDALYNVGGVPIRRDETGASGTNVGSEIDFVANFHLARYTDLLVGYSKLFGGGFLKGTAGQGGASDAELFHLTFQQKW